MKFKACSKAEEAETAGVVQKRPETRAADRIVVIKRLESERAVRSSNVCTRVFSSATFSSVLPAASTAAPAMVPTLRVSFVYASLRKYIC